MTKSYYAIDLHGNESNGLHCMLYFAAGTSEAEAQRALRVARRHGCKAAIVRRDTAPEQGGLSMSEMLDTIRA